MPKMCSNVAGVILALILKTVPKKILWNSTHACKLRSYRQIAFFTLAERKQTVNPKTF